MSLGFRVLVGLGFGTTREMTPSPKPKGLWLRTGREAENAKQPPNSINSRIRYLEYNPSKVGD